MYTKNILHRPTVTYRDSDHTYRRDDELLTSVTSFIEKYTVEFDEDFWSRYKTLEAMFSDYDFKKAKRKFSFLSPLLIEHLEEKVDPHTYGRKRRSLIREWSLNNKLACVSGTKYHNEQEELSILRGIECNPFTGEYVKVHVRKPLDDYDNYSLHHDLYKLEDGYYPELLVWLDKYGLGGMSDRVFIETIGRNRYVDLDDYKTNEKITSDENFFAYLKPPLQDVKDTKFNRYSIQLCIYAYMLESFGFRVRHLAFHHFDKRYPVEYNRARVELMLNYREPVFPFQFPSE